jgi:dihydrofolate reductase
MDAVVGRVMGEDMARGGALLFGRRTYEDFFGYWPRQKDNPFTPVLNERRKYVASRTLTEPLPWDNSTLLEGDAADAVAELKERLDEDLTVMGSGELVQSLARRDLVDEYVLLIHPLVLGSGRLLFPQDGPSATLRLVEVTPTTTGVLVARYRPAGMETAA